MAQTERVGEARSPGRLTCVRNTETTTVERTLYTYQPNQIQGGTPQPVPVQTEVTKTTVVTRTEYEGGEDDAGSAG